MVVATYTINDKRKERITFAGPYYVAGQDIMVQRGQPEGHHRPGLVQDQRREGVLGHGFDAERRTSSSTSAARDQLVLFDVYSKCADALRTGQVDAVTTDNVILLGLIVASADEVRARR